MFKTLIQKNLERLTKKYLKKHKPKLVVITGSVGKTSTKLAIATVLSQHFKVRVHSGNHNTHMSVPLGILGIDYPDNIRSPLAWLKVRQAAKLRINGPKDVDVIVQELGTDAPGEIAYFGTYLRPDIAVVTAVSPEHMEFFKTIDAVAKEELAVAKFSALTAINRDDINEDYAPYAETSIIDTFGLGGTAEYHFTTEDNVIADGYKGMFISPEFEQLPVTLRVVGEHNIKACVAAGMVGAKLGMKAGDVATGLQKIRPAAGRMNLLRGVNSATIIDDSYNSSPLAASAALQTLYSIAAPQRIAILGSMNELGDSSSSEHVALGALCDPALLAWVITIGDEAAKHLAPAARKRGNQIKCFKTAIEAGAFAHKVLEAGAVVLVKGSQGAIFSEEAVKVLLHATGDEQYLVRQSSAWLATKKKFFDTVYAK